MEILKRCICMQSVTYTTIATGTSGIVRRERRLRCPRGRLMNLLLVSRKDCVLRSCIIYVYVFTWLHHTCWQLHIYNIHTYIYIYDIYRYTHHIYIYICVCKCMHIYLYVYVCTCVAAGVEKGLCPEVLCCIIIFLHSYMFIWIYAHTYNRYITMCIYT